MKNILNELKTYYNDKEITYLFKQEYTRLVEDLEFIPRFTLKNVSDIANIPINEPMKYDQNIIIKAIRYGMIFLINYRGEKDNLQAGHERVIYPMVLGRSTKGKVLLRGWHLRGWSVSNDTNTEKIWRMFRADRILSMTFTGAFYRLPPEGYNMNDKGMRGGIIARADFNEIRKNQHYLVQRKTILDKEDVTLTKDEKGEFPVILVQETGTKLDMLKASENPIISRAMENTAGFRITFMKSVYGDQYIAVLGAIGKPGNTVRIVTDKKRSLSVYKVLDSITGDVLNKIKNIKANREFDLFVFDKKL